MKSKKKNHDRREDRLEREEKLGRPAETLPAKTLSDRNRHARRLKEISVSEPFYPGS